MSDGISFDFSELDELAADLAAVPPEAVKTLDSAFRFTAHRIKQGAAKKVSGRRHWKQAASAIDYDVEHTPTGPEAEIGYDKSKRAGPLGNLVEFGAPGAPNALTPGNELVSTLHEEREDFVRGIERAIDDAHKQAGLT